MASVGMKQVCVVDVKARRTFGCFYSKTIATKLARKLTAERGTRFVSMSMARARAHCRGGQR